MIERYLPQAMRAIWADQRRFELWLQIEILACEAWAELGRIPKEALPAIRRAGFEIDRIKEIESTVGHDVIAFLTSVGETIGIESRYVHLGLTSSDIVDTAFAVQIKQSAEVILADLAAVREAAVALAIRHRRTVMIGRSHGIHAEPITFGFKVAGWVAELDRDLERLAAAMDSVSVGKLSGAVGTHATVDPRLEEYVCRHLGIGVDPVSTQVVSRDRHAAFMSTLALAAGTLERIAVEIRHLQRTEVGEALEPFGAGQKGSSAMPHKRNPVSCEQMSGLARTIRGYAATALENVALWHERDISHSSAERIIFPDACALLDHMALTMGRVLGGLEVRTERMARNLTMGGGVVFSQRVLLALVEFGMSREDAYKIVQSAAHRALDENGNFRSLLELEPAVMALGSGRLDACFDPEAGLEHIDLAFDRLGLATNSGVGA